MKKIIVAVLVLTLLVSVVGCGSKEEPIVASKEEAKVVKPTPEEKEKLETLLVTGIVGDINNNMITLIDITGLNGEPSVVALISDETIWQAPEDFLTVGKFIEVELSPMMTRSLPPQSNAIKVVSMNDIVTGEILEITDDLIRLKPTINYSSFEEIIVLLGADTEWEVEKSTLAEGDLTSIMLESIMTSSLPPQIMGLKVLPVRAEE